MTRATLDLRDRRVGTELPTRRRLARRDGAVIRRNIARLSVEQEAHLLVGRMLGDSLDATFGDDATRRRAWDLHRERLIAEHVREFPGTRPHAWWLYEAPPTHRPRESSVGFDERPVLEALGVLADNERTALAALDAKRAQFVSVADLD